MIWVQDTDEKCIFSDLYEDDEFDFLNKRTIDTVEAREKLEGIRKKADELEKLLDRVEGTERRNDLFSRYVRGELPHIHCSDDKIANVFSDALSIQADRIFENLEKALPKLTKEEIKNACFRGDINKEQE